MPARLHDVSDDGFLAQLLARLQTMQPFHQYETFAVLPHQIGLCRPTWRMLSAIS
jgi:hypothetical protein